MAGALSDLWFTLPSASLPGAWYHIGLLRHRAKSVNNFPTVLMPNLLCYHAHHDVYNDAIMVHKQFHSGISEWQCTTTNITKTAANVAEIIITIHVVTDTCLKAI